MSNFLSQLDLNPEVDQNGDDEEDFEKEDFEREKEIKELIANEFNEDEFFEDDSSFTSHQTSTNDLDASPSYNQFQNFPNRGAGREMPVVSMHGPLLTSRGNDFISKISPQNQDRSVLGFNNKPGNMYIERTQNGKAYIDPKRDAFLLSSYDNDGNSCNGNWPDAAQIHGFEVQADNYEDVVPPLHLYQGLEMTKGDTIQLNGNSYIEQNHRTSVDQYSSDSFHQHFNDTRKSFEDDMIITNRQHAFDGLDSQTSHSSYYDHFGNGKTVNDVDLSNNDQSHDLKDMPETQDVIGDSMNLKGHSQLRVLYEARGRKIEQLQEALDSATEVNAKEIRILQHRLTLITGERDGIKITLQQSQELHMEELNKVNDLQERLSDEKKKNKELDSEIDELSQKLEMSESAIESLNQQLASLNRADSLAKMRSQHEMIMATSRQKHEEEVLLLKEKLDDTRKELNWKTEDVNRLQDEIQSGKKYMDQLKIESAETINRLTKSLEESQRQMRDMLEEGTMHDIGETKYLLKQSAKEKGRFEEENMELKEEIKDVKEQLNLYEVALSSAVDGPSSSTPYHGHDAAQKFLPLDSFKTPLSRFSKESKVSESPFFSLRDELVKALASNKSKREELDNAKAQIDSLKGQLEETSNEKRLLVIANEALKAENVAYSVGMKDYCKEGSEGACENEIKVNKDFLSELELKLKISDEKIEILESEIKQSQNENTMLKREVAEVLQQFDKDKIEAIKNCEKTYSTFNEDAKQHLEKTLKEAHAEQVAILSDEIKQLKSELLDVKDSYILLANENKVIDQQVRAECEKENEQRINELKSTMSASNKEELRKMEERLSNESYSQMDELRKQLKMEFEEEARHRIETAVALAKVEWFAEYEDDKTKSIQRAVENAKLKFGRDADLEKQEIIQSLKEEWEQEKEDKFGKRLEASIQAARENWEEVARVETEKAIEDALDGFKEEQLLKQEKDVEQELDLMKEKDALQQQILREESQRIRIELLRGFAEDQSHLSESASFPESESNVCSELKETITYVKSIYERKLSEQKEEFENHVKKAKESWKKELDFQLERKIVENRTDLEREKNKEKELAIAKLNESWEKRMMEIKKEEEKRYENTMDKKLEKSKSDWKKELDDLQREHDLALRNMISDLKSKSNAEREELEKELKEVICRLKKENSDKLDRQKTDLEAYHSDLTKKTLEHARKEWEIEFSYRFQGTSAARSKRALSETSYNQVHEMDARANRENSDSGFTSPFFQAVPRSNVPHVRNSTRVDDNQTFGPLTSNKDHSPSHEILLSKIEADLVMMKGEKLLPQAGEVKHVSTQTDLLGKDNANALQEMRRYYLDAISKIKEDVTKHISKTKENASTRIRKEVAKERKTLIDQIRKKYLKNLKFEDAKRVSNRREVAILQILKEVDIEENDEPRATKENRDAILKEKKPTLDGLPEASDTGRRPSRPAVRNSTVSGNKTTSSVNPRKGRNFPASSDRKVTKIESSPSNSFFSCESNGTLYTELPSTSLDTLSLEKSRRG